MYSLLEELMCLPGVPGYEHLVRERILQEIKDHCTWQVDAMGNLITTLGEGEKELLLAAHMDEIGMVVSHIEDLGFLRVRKMGGLDPRVVVGQRVQVVTEKGTLPGAVGIVPPHLMIDRAEMKKPISFEQMCIDIGAATCEEAQEMGVNVLDQVVLEKNLSVLNDRFLMGRGLDNRLGCWILLRLFQALIQEKPAMRVTFAWTVQEEIGLRGAQMMAQSYRPDYIIAIDTISTGSIPQSSPHLANAVPGKGPALRMIDSRGIASFWFRDKILQLARQHNIPVQVATAGGSTDGAALQMTGAHMIPIAFPLRYTHAPCEMAHKEDIEHMLQLLSKIPTVLAVET